MCAESTEATAYEQGSFQVVLNLQKLYGFVVMDYSFHGLVLYRKIEKLLYCIPSCFCNIRVAIFQWIFLFHLSCLQIVDINLGFYRAHGCAQITSGNEAWRCGDWRVERIVGVKLKSRGSKAAKRVAFEFYTRGRVQPLFTTHTFLLRLK